LKGKKVAMVSLKEQIVERIVPGTVFQNPGGGISTIVSVSDETLCYKRGHSNLYVKLEDLEDAYNRFRGFMVHTNTLKSFRPDVFSSKHSGHGCNCTFLFQILVYLELTQNGILGSGTPGDTFHVKIK
jgi:hypothetical protein